MNATCPNKVATDSLIDYCAGTLAAQEAEAVEAHLRECSVCDELVRAQKSAWALLGEWQAPPVSEDFDERLYRRLESEKQVPWTSRIWNGILKPALSPWKPAIPLGAAALALTVGLLLRTPPYAPVVSSVPFAVEPATTSASQSVDIEQVESALNDLDLLSPMTRRGAI